VNEQAGPCFQHLSKITKGESMASGASFCPKESRRIEEIRDVHEQKFVESFAHIGGKQEIKPERGNMPINHIQLLLCSHRAY